MGKQLYEEGDKLANGLVVTGVQYSEDPETQERYGFTYLVRSTTEVENERKVAEEIERKRAEDQRLADEEDERNRPKPEDTATESDQA